MPLTTVADYQLAINEILYAQFKNRGTRFPFLEITRDGGMSNADAITLRDAFDAYYTLRQARPTLIPAHEDKAAQIHKTDLHGRTGRGQKPAGEDVASTIHQTNQTGDSDKGTTNDSPQTNRGTDSTGRR